MGRSARLLPKVGFSAFSPDAKILSTGGYDRAVQLWAAATCRPIRPPRRVKIFKWLRITGYVSIGREPADHVVRERFGSDVTNQDMTTLGDIRGDGHADEAAFSS